MAASIELSARVCASAAIASIFFMHCTYHDRHAPTSNRVGVYGIGHPRKRHFGLQMASRMATSRQAHPTCEHRARDLGSRKPKIRIVVCRPRACTGSRGYRRWGVGVLMR
jgi:hypothetical protein